MNWMLTFILVSLVILVNGLGLSRIQKSTKNNMKNKFSKIGKFFLKMGLTPNLLTLLSLLTGILSFFLLINLKFELFLAFYVISLLLDGLDGFLARTTNKISKLGENMDLITDAVTRRLILFGFWFVYRNSIIVYALPILYLIRKWDFYLSYFIEPFIILAVFLPYESLAALTICIIINFVLTVFSGKFHKVFFE